MGHDEPMKRMDKQVILKDRARGDEDVIKIWLQTFSNTEIGANCSNSFRVRAMTHPARSAFFEVEKRAGNRYRFPLPLRYCQDQIAIALLVAQLAVANR